MKPMPNANAPVSWLRAARNLALLSFLGAVASSASAAITLSFDPATPSFKSGATVDVALVISGLTAGAAPGVGAFDLNVAYDSALLTATGVTFGTKLGDPATDTLTDSVLSTPGNVNVAQVSLLPTADLIALQPASFTLATISFTALADGKGAFSLVGDLRVDDPLGNKLPVVPEPGSIALSAAGLIALGWRVRSRRRLRRCAMAAGASASGATAADVLT